MNQAYPKSARLRYRRQFEQLARYGCRLKGQWISLEVRFTSRSKSHCLPRLGITVTKKFGKAHDRNRFKRIIREAFRSCIEQLPKGLDINVRPCYSHKINPVSLKKQDIEKELLELIAGFSLRDSKQ